MFGLENNLTVFETRKAVSMLDAVFSITRLVSSPFKTCDEYQLCAVGELRFTKLFEVPIHVSITTTEAGYDHESVLELSATVAGQQLEEKLVIPPAPGDCWMLVQCLRGDTPDEAVYASVAAFMARVCVAVGQPSFNCLTARKYPLAMAA